MTISFCIILRKRNVSGKISGENQNTFYVQLIFFPKILVYGVMWKNIVGWRVHRWQNGACAMHTGYL